MPAGWWVGGHAGAATDGCSLALSRRPARWSGRRRLLAAAGRLPAMSARTSRRPGGRGVVGGLVVGCGGAAGGVNEGAGRARELAPQERERREERGEEGREKRRSVPPVADRQPPRHKQIIQDSDGGDVPRSPRNENTISDARGDRRAARSARWCTLIIAGTAGSSLPRAKRLLLRLANSSGC